MGKIFIVGAFGDLLSIFELKDYGVGAQRRLKSIWEFANGDGWGTLDLSSGS